MLNIFGFGYAREKGKKDKNQFNEIEEISYASGTCLFTSSSVLNKVGLFDPFIFLYHDDLGLGMESFTIRNKILLCSNIYNLSC